MTSYHRVLKTFDRPDIDPWDILIDGQRWPGKIRLLGYLDVFFLICYSGPSLFEKGIIIYKDDDAVIRILTDSRFSEERKEEFALSQRLRSKDTTGSKEKQKFFNFLDDAGALDYTITGVGHPIAVKAEYPQTWLKPYEIKLRKHKNPVIRRRMCRGLDHHSFSDLMMDVVRLGILTHAELTAHIMSNALAGTATDDTFRKYRELVSGGGSGEGMNVS